MHGPWDLVWRVARSEGPRAVWERTADRLAAARRRRSFPTIDVADLGGSLPNPWPRILGDRDLRALDLRRTAPRVLNVLATEPRPDLGGVQTQFALRFDAEHRRRPGALLFPSGDGYRLELSSRPETQKQQLAIHWPNTRTDEADELARVLRDAADRVGADLVHVEQPLGLPLDAWQSLDRPLVVSLHDFGMFCRRPHLLERPQMEFCSFCRDDARCVACLQQTWPTHPGDPKQRRDQCLSILEQASALVFPSDYLRRTYLHLYPTLHPARTHIVAPPSHRPQLPPADDRRRRKNLRVAFVGSVKPHKGSEIFEQVVTLHGASTGSARKIQWHAFGGGDAPALRELRQRGVKIHGYYRSGSLARRLRSERIDLALVLSVWPETYCMVVDECLHAGIPVLAFDLGAPADRLPDAGGLLVPTEEGARGVFEAIETLASGRRPLPEVASPDLPTPDAAAENVCNLYAQLNARRES